MAKITMEFDTKDKTLSVKIDGKEIENISSMSAYEVYSDKGKFMFDVTSRTPSEDGDMVTMTHIMASEDGKVEKTISKEVDNKVLKNISRALLRR